MSSRRDDSLFYNCTVSAEGYTKQSVLYFWLQSSFHSTATCKVPDPIDFVMRSDFLPPFFADHQQQIIISSFIRMPSQANPEDRAVFR